MNVEFLRKYGIFFSYCSNAAFPQIPYVQDVLYVLQLSNDKDTHGNYSPAGAANWGDYIENTTLVAAAVASKVLFMERYDEAAARKIIAQAIVDLCPSQARCLFNRPFVEAQDECTGKAVRSRTASRDEIIRACECPECRAIRANEGL